MIFRDQTYSVLIVSASEKFNDSLVKLLPNYSFYPVKITDNIASAKRLTLEKKYDIVLINAPLPDDFGSNFAIGLSSSKNTICLIFVKADQEQEIASKVNSHGVFTLAKPNSAAMIRHALDYLSTARERLRIIESASLSLEDKMEEIKLVNRAKWLLIEHLKMTEEDAHHYLEKQAMNRSITRREVAENIINLYK